MPKLVTAHTASSNLAKNENVMVKNATTTLWISIYDYDIEQIIPPPPVMRERGREKKLFLFHSCLSAALYFALHYDYYHIFARTSKSYNKEFSSYVWHDFVGVRFSFFYYLRFAFAVLCFCALFDSIFAVVLDFLLHRIHRIHSANICFSHDFVHSYASSSSSSSQSLFRSFCPLPLSLTLFLLLLLLRSYVCVLSSVLYSSVSRLCAYHTTFSYCCIYSLFSLVIVRLCVTFTCWFFFLLALSLSPLFAFELVCCVHCVCLYKYIAVNIHIWTGTYRAYYMFVLVQSLHCKYKLWWKKREEHREHFHVENYIFLSLLACISCISFLAFYFCSLLMHPSAISLLSVCLPSSHTYIHTFSNVACSISRKTFPVETCHPMVFICTTAFHLFFIFCASRWFFSFFCSFRFSLLHSLSLPISFFFSPRQAECILFLYVNLFSVCFTFFVCILRTAVCNMLDESMAGKWRTFTGMQTNSSWYAE